MQTSSTLEATHFHLFNPKAKLIHPVGLVWVVEVTSILTREKVLVGERVQTALNAVGRE